MKKMNQQIKKLREEASLTPTQLAERSNLSLAFISKLEGGGYKSLSLRTCKKLAEGLGLSLRDFLNSIGFLNSNNEQPSLQLVNQALRGIGYTSEQVDEIMRYAEYLRNEARKHK